MVALVVVLIGFAMIFSQKDFAKSLVRPLFGLILIVSFAPALLNSCASALGSTSAPAAPSGSVLGVMIFLGLALVGWVAWKRRAARKKHEDAFRKRHGHPRRRGLPPAPFHEDGE